jgi:hypothetical protein
MWMFACIFLFIKWYDIVVSSSECFIWIDLAHAQSCIWLNKKSIKPWWFTLPQSSCIIFIPILILFLLQAWLWQLLLSRLSLPSLLLAFTYTEREYFSCIQLLKTKLFQRVHYKFLCMVFQTIPSKFSCATFQNLQILVISWHYF